MAFTVPMPDRLAPPLEVCVLVEARYLAQAQPAGVVRALTDRGVRVRTVVAEAACVDLSTGAWVRGISLVLARGRSTALLSLLRSAEQSGVPVVNGAAEVQAVVDKAGMAATLSAAGVPTPTTWLGTPADLAQLPDVVFPLVLKPVTGDNARGLVVVRTGAELAALVWPEPLALAQEFHRGEGYDVKLYVAGDAVWAVRRPSPVEETGAPRDARDAGVPVPVTPPLRALARECGRLFGLELFGVDCVRRADGTYLVVEVNDFPNYRGLAAGADEVLAEHVLSLLAPRHGPARTRARMTASARAVIIGAGNVGCGLAAEQLHDAGYRVVVVTRTASSAAVLAAHGVRVRYTGEATRPDRLIRPDLVLPATATAEVMEQIVHASVVLVTVGPGDHAALAPLLAAGLMARHTPVDVLVCDNRDEAAENLRALVAEHGDERVLRHGFAGALVDRIITRPPQVSPGLLLVAESTGRLYVDAHALRNPPPAMEQLVLVEDFQACVTRKLFVFSAGHAASAYLGALQGHHLLRDALGDADVRPVVRAAMREGQVGLAATFGEEFAGGDADLDHALRRFADPALDDTVERVGRDPLRKLGARDRICGPARLAMAAGASTPALAVVAAAALRLSDPTLQRHLDRLGADRVLAGCGQLSHRNPFVELTLAAGRLIDAAAPLATVLAALTGVPAATRPRRTPFDLGATR